MSSILNVIKHYQKSIENSSKDEVRLLHCIKKLSELRVTVEHLQETGIGKTVNSLRKCSGETGLAARALVTKWKAMVAAEEEAMETSGDDSNNGKNSKDSESDDNQNGDYRNHHNSANDASDQQHHRTHTQQHHKQKDSNKHTSDNVSSNKHSSRNSSHHSNSQSHHNSSSSKHRANSGQHPEKIDNEKHHSSRAEKVKKSEHKEREKDKRKEEKSEVKQISSSSAKRENSKDESNHHREKELKSGGSDRQASSKSREKHDADHQTKSKEKKRDKSKSSSKEKEHRHKQKSISSISSKVPTLAATASTSDATPSTSSRKRNFNDENDSNEAISPQIKKLKIDQAAKYNNDEDADDGIDSSMGANFADVLGMLNMPTKKSKKTLNTQKSPTASTSKSIISHPKPPSSTAQPITSTAPSSTKRSPDEKPDLLSSTAKLEPLDPSIALELPPISTNYKPLPRNQTVMDCVFKDYATPSAPKAMVRTLTDAEALSHGISSKTMRTKIYSGVKTGQILQVAPLFDLCIRILQKNIDALEYTGGVPFEVLRPVIDRATPQQLLTFEEYNPYVMEDSDVLWQTHVQRNYRSQKRKEMESWREMFLRCQEEEERKLIKLAEGIKQSQKIIAAPVRKTQLAFVDSMVKPPRNVLRKQEQYGTKAKLIATPAARVAALSSVTPNAVKSGDVRLRVAASVRDAAQVSHTAVRPKKAPLMAKTLQFMRGRQKR